MHSQLKSKARVANHGEVFTAPREVNAMLDLVKHETERIESRFLEPACGTGNFLIEVLNRKMNIVENRYKKNQTDYERYAFIAISSIYGIDLLEDNIIECRDRLFVLFEERYKKLFKSKCMKSYLKSIYFILKQNIIHGDALTFKQVDGSAKPIIFAEWSFIDTAQIKRKDYSFEQLHDTQFGDDAGLFSDLGDEVIIPTPIKEYPLTNYLRLGQDA